MRWVQDLELKPKGESDHHVGFGLARVAVRRQPVAAQQDRDETAVDRIREPVVVLHGRVQALERLSVRQDCMQDRLPVVFGHAEVVCLHLLKRNPRGPGSQPTYLNLESQDPEDHQG